MTDRIPGLWAISEDGLEQVRAMRARADAVRPFVSLPDSDASPRPYSVAADGTATIGVRGPIFARMDLLTALFSGGTTYGAITGAVDLAAGDPAVQRIMLDIDSPGGEVAGLVEAANALAEAGRRKPVDTYARKALSAAYVLAAATRNISAEPVALLGSIGVRSDLLDDRERLKQMGVTRRTVVSSQSPRKVVDFDAEDGLADIQRAVDDTADVLIGQIASYRNTTTEKVLADFGRGAALSAARALDAGLIDSITGAKPSAPAEEPTRASGESGATDKGDSMSTPTEEAGMATGLPQDAPRAVGPDEVVVTQAELDGLRAEAERIPALEAKVAALESEASAADDLREKLETVERIAAESAANLAARDEADRIRVRDEIIAKARAEERIRKGDEDKWRAKGDRLGNDELADTLELIAKGAATWKHTPGGTVRDEDIDEEKDPGARLKAEVERLVAEGKTVQQAVSAIRKDRPDLYAAAYGLKGGVQ